jgi:hypothetical protein
VRSWRTAILTLALAAGCSVEVASLKLAAVHPLSTEVLGSATSQGWREGQSCRFWLLGIPFGLPQVDEAVHDALASVGGGFMRDVTVFSEHPVYVVYGWHCYRVRGEVFGGTR